LPALNAAKAARMSMSGEPFVGSPAGSVAIGEKPVQSNRTQAATALPLIAARLAASMRL